MVCRPTTRVLTVLGDIKHTMDLETVSLKDLFRYISTSYFASLGLRKNPLLSHRIY